MRYGILLILMTAAAGCTSQLNNDAANNQEVAKSGYCIVEVTVTKEGNTRDHKIIEYQPEDYGFGEASLKASAKLKYSPRIVDGVPVEVPSVLSKFNFKINESYKQARPAPSGLG